MGRSAFVIVLAGTSCLVHIDMARGQMAVGSYRGRLECAKLPFTTGPQRALVQIRVNGGRVTYSRAVQNESGTATVGTESGAGTIAGDGAANSYGQLARLTRQLLGILFRQIER